ncbi:MAG: tRNA (guanosine(37)-N1)-methyltransferase TrmD [Coriobacteriia bacterium]|nr:tRNA (guanosine(37)-N1)-methyltransferase TrmD [Coriobacteriia bacterium]
MIIETLSVFPEMFENVMSLSILGRARQSKLFEYKGYNLRDWTHDVHRSVDDVPYGGGAGMLMKPEPIFEAIKDISATGPRPSVIFFSPTGTPFNQKLAHKLSQKERLLFFCSRYEGVDERAYTLADYTLSLGDFVLSGGELAAMVVTDAIVRLLPGALGNDDSARDESFSSSGLLEYEQYTRPQSYRGLEVPPVLLSGNHQAIDAFRRESAIKKTLKFRPDLLAHARLSEEERLKLSEGFYIDKDEA